MNFGQTPHFYFFSSLFFPLSLQTDQEITLAGHPSLSLSYSSCPVASGHKGWVRPKAILQRLPYSISLTLSTPDPQSMTSCCSGGTPRPHSPATEPLHLTFSLSLADADRAHTRGDRGFGGKPAVAASPSAPSGHRRRSPIVASRPDQP
jgi:hypothetical protein